MVEAFVQNAYVVPDLVAASRRFHEQFGIGPFFLRSSQELQNVTYRGQPATEPVVTELLLAQAGGIQLELIAQSSPGPSAYRDVFAADEMGFHHAAIFATDYEGTKQSYIDAGYPLAMEMAGPGDCRICYLDARSDLGHMIEIYPEVPVLRQVYAFVREETAHWDGTGELIRALQLGPSA